MTCFIQYDSTLLANQQLSYIPGREVQYSDPTRSHANPDNDCLTILEYDCEPNLVDPDNSTTIQFVLEYIFRTADICVQSVYIGSLVHMYREYLYMFICTRCTTFRSYLSYAKTLYAFAPTGWRVGDLIFPQWRWQGEGQGQVQWRYKRPVRCTGAYILPLSGEQQELGCR